MKPSFLRHVRADRGAAVLLILGSATVAAAAVALLVPSGGSARSQVAPSNTVKPTIAGEAVEGNTLRASPGEWSGTAPITFEYQWLRCNGSGDRCREVAGETNQTFRLGDEDVGSRMRVRVTASNDDGSARTTSAPTAAIAGTPAPPATGCPSGRGTVQVTQVQPPARLLVDGQQITPPSVSGSTQEIVARFHVSNTCGQTVQGALVYLTAVPYNQFSVAPEAETGADGWATLRMTRLSGFPATSKQQLLVFFVRARKSGENVLAGISTRRLVSFKVALSS